MPIFADSLHAVDTIAAGMGGVVSLSEGAHVADTVTASMGGVVRLNEAVHVTDTVAASLSNVRVSLSQTVHMADTVSVFMSPAPPAFLSALAASRRRTLRTFLEFSADDNSAISGVIGAVPQQYGFRGDNTEAVPVKNTALSLGRFTRAIANNLVAPETPQCQVRLTDAPSNQWRQWQAQPGVLHDRTMRIKARLKLNNGLALDHTLFSGLAKDFTYPPGATQFTLYDTFGDIFGRQIPRDRLRLTDWPNAPTANVGQAFPIIYGDMDNSLTEAGSLTATLGTMTGVVVSGLTGFTSIGAAESIARRYYYAIVPLIGDIAIAEPDITSVIVTGTNQLVTLNWHAYSGPGDGLRIYRSGSRTFRDFDTVNSGISPGTTTFVDHTAGYNNISPLPPTLGVDFYGDVRETLYYWVTALTAAGGGNLAIPFDNSLTPITNVFMTGDTGDGTFTTPLVLAICPVYGGIEGPPAFTSIGTDGLPNGVIIRWDEPAVAPDSYRIYVFTSGGYDPHVAGSGGAQTFIRLLTHDAVTHDGITTPDGLGGYVTTDFALYIHNPTDGADYSGATAIVTPTLTSGPASVAIQPVNRHGQRRVTLSWNLVAGATSTRIVRASQKRGFARVFDREWTFNANLTSFVDWMQDTSAVPDIPPLIGIVRPGAVKCVYVNSNPGGTGTFDYVVAQHAVASVDQVYVTKAPVTQAGTPAGSLDQPHGLMGSIVGTPGSTLLRYVVSAKNLVGETTTSNAVTFANGPDTLNGSNYIQLSWDTVIGATSYRIYKSVGATDFGLMADSLVASIADTGITVNSGIHTPEANTTGDGFGSGQVSTDVPTLMTLNGDYAVSTREVGGKRYTVISFSADQGTNAVTANVSGIEDIGNSTGSVIDAFFLQFLHFLLNWVFNSYKTGAWFTSSPFINGDSFDAAQAVSETRISGGYIGAGLIDTATDALQAIDEWLVCTDVDLYFWDGEMEVLLPSGARPDASTLEKLSPQLGIGVDTPFTITVDGSQVFSELTWQAGAQADGFLTSGTTTTPADPLFGEAVSPMLTFRWLRIGATLTDALTRRARQAAAPIIQAAFSAPFSLVAHKLASFIAMDHPDGIALTNAGWVDQVCKIVRSDADLDKKTLVLTVEASTPVAAIPVGSLLFSSGGTHPVQFTDPDGNDLASPVLQQFGAGSLEGEGVAQNADGITYVNQDESLKVYSSRLSLLAIPATSANVATGLSVDGAGRGYVLLGALGVSRLIQSNAAGAVTATWTVTGDGTGRSCLAVNANASLAFMGNSSHKVYGWDLLGNSDLGAVITESTDYRIEGMIILGNGQLVVQWQDESFVPNRTLVKRYDLSYAEVASYALPFEPSNSTACITPGLTDASFWVTTTKFGGGFGTVNETRIYEIQVSDGAYLHSFSKLTVAVPASFEWSEGFCVVRKALA